MTIKQTLTVGALTLLIAGCAPEDVNSISTTETTTSTGDVVLDTTKQRENARVNLAFKFPENASGAVVLQDTTLLELDFIPVSFSRWSEYFSYSMGYNSLDEYMDVTDDITWDIWAFASNIGDFITGEPVSITLSASSAQAQLDLPPGNWLISADQVSNEGTVYSSALMLAQLPEGEHQVALKMLAGSWDFVDENGDPRPLKLELVNRALLDLDTDGVITTDDQPNQVEPLLESDDNAIKGFHLINESEHFLQKLVFNHVLPVTVSNGLDRIQNIDREIIEGPEYSERESLNIQAGAIQEYYIDSEGQPVTGANFTLGGDLLNYYEYGSSNNSDFSISYSLQTIAENGQEFAADYFNANSIDTTEIDYYRVEDCSQEPCQVYLEASYYIENTVIDDNQHNVGGEPLSPDRLNPTAVIEGNRITGTMIEVLGLGQYGSASGNVDIPDLTEPDLINPDLGSYDGEALALAVKTKQSLDNLAVGAGLLANAANAPTEACTSFSTIDNYYSGAGYYWDVANSQWISGSKNPVQSWSSSRFADLDELEGDTTDAIEQTTARINYNRNSSSFGQELDQIRVYDGTYVIDADSGEYITVTPADIDYRYGSYNTPTRSGYAAGPLDLKRFGTELGTEFECQTNLLDGICLFDDLPPDADSNGLYNLIEDGLGTQEEGLAPETETAFIETVDAGTHIILTADMDSDGNNEDFLVATDGSDGWNDNQDGTWSNDTETAAVLLGAPHHEIAFINRDFYNYLSTSNHIDVFVETGYYCYDPEQNGCIVDLTWEDNIADLNEDGLLEAIEMISQPKMFHQESGSSETIVCWQDFILQGRTLEASAIEFVSNWVEPEQPF